VGSNYRQDFMAHLPHVKHSGVVQLWQWITNPIKFLHESHRQYGDSFVVQMGGLFNDCVFTSHPEAIQQVLTDDAFVTPGSANQVLRPFLGDRGIILLDGLEHRQRRQLVMPAFHGDKIRVYTDLIQQITRDVIQQWPVNETLNAREQMQSISLSVILQAVFGIYQGEQFDGRRPVEDHRIRQKLIAVLSLTDSPLKSSFILIPKLQQDWGAWSPWGRFKRDLAELDRLLFQEIADRRQNYDPNRSDILNLLIGSQDEEGQGMDDQELRDELMTLLFAGHETTATALSWGIYWSSYLPEVRAKLMAEIATLGPDRDIKEINKLPYLGAFCSEVLRIHPVAMLIFPRITQKSVRLQGCDLAPGTTVMGCVYLAHHRPEVYPEPEVFNPQRFLDRQYSPYEYFPFGGGSRRCIGLALAQMELKLIMVEILASCQIELMDKLPIAPARRGVTLAPQTGVNIKVVKKH
jgi:cytochrome P450 family 110